MFTVTSPLVPTSAPNCPTLVQVSTGSHPHFAPLHHHPQLNSPMHHHHIHHLNSANVAALIAAGHHVAHHPMSNSSEYGTLGINGTPGGMTSNGWPQYSAIDPYAMKQAQGAQQQYADYHLLMSTFAAPPPPPPSTNSSYSTCNNSTNRTLSSNGNCAPNSHYSHNHYSSSGLDKHVNINGHHQPNGTHHQHHQQHSSSTSSSSVEQTRLSATKEQGSATLPDTGTACSSTAPLTPSTSTTSNSSSSLSSPLSSISSAAGVPITVNTSTSTSTSTSTNSNNKSIPAGSSNSVISSYCSMPIASSTSAVANSPAIPALISASNTGNHSSNYPQHQHHNPHNVTSSVNNHQLASSSSSSSSTSNYYQPIKDTTFTKIFVGGLPYHTTDKSLRAFFETFGELEEAVVITDRQTGKSRGYGFVTMADRDSAERAVKEANPIIDGRKANVNLAYLGAKPRNGFLQNGYPFSSLSRSSATVSTATGAYATFPSSNATAAAFGPGSQFGFAAQPHIVYHPGSASLAGTSATSPPGTFLPPATPTGLILTPPGTFYADYGLGPGAGSNTNPFAAASGYADATILTPFLTPTFGPSSSIVATSTAGHHHQQHYSNGNGGHHSSQQAIAAAAAAALVGMTPTASVSSTVGSPATQSNSSAASAAAATAAAAAFYLNGPTTNGFLTGAYLTDTRI